MTLCCNCDSNQRHSITIENNFRKKWATHRASATYLSIPFNSKYFICTTLFYFWLTGYVQNTDLCSSFDTGSVTLIDNDIQNILQKKTDTPFFLFKANIISLHYVIDSIFCFKFQLLSAVMDAFVDVLACIIECILIL